MSKPISKPAGKPADEPAVPDEAASVEGAVDKLGPTESASAGTASAGVTTSAAEASETTPLEEAADASVFPETNSADTAPRDGLPAATQRLEESPVEVPVAEAEGRAEQAVADPRIRRPRIRWGAIVWGLIVCAIAAAILQVTRTAEGREGFVLWLTRLNPGGIWLIVVLVLGSILLLLGLLSAIRRLQRR